MPLSSRSRLPPCRCKSLRSSRLLFEVLPYRPRLLRVTFPRFPSPQGDMAERVRRNAPAATCGDPRHQRLCAAVLIEALPRPHVQEPLLDRIDLHVEVPRSACASCAPAPGEPTRIVAERVAAARLLQQERFGAAASTPVNAAMGPEDLQPLVHGGRRRPLDARPLLRKARSLDASPRPHPKEGSVRIVIVVSPAATRCAFSEANSMACAASSEWCF